jgi:hypothetical protein
LDGAAPQSTAEVAGNTSPRCARQADAVEITWPSAARTTLGALAGDRRWRLVEGEAAATPAGR